MELPLTSAPLWFTPRERAVGSRLCRRKSNKEIGYELNISTATARDHVSRLISKLRDNGVDVANRLDVAEWFRQHRDAIEAGYSRDTDEKPLAFHEEGCSCDYCATLPRFDAAA